MINHDFDVRRAEMFISKRVLVAVDGSPSGENALRQAFRIAGAGVVRVISAYPPLEEGEGLYISSMSYMGALKAPAEAAIKRALEIAHEAGVKVESAVMEGEAYYVISQEAARWKADLVIMGRRGISRLDRVLMGSTSNRTIAHCDCNIIIFPLNTEIKPSVVLAATDGSSLAAVAVDEAMAFAASKKGKLVLVSAVEYNVELEALAPDIVEKMQEKVFKELEATSKKASEMGVEIQVVVKGGKPFDVIVSTAEETGAGIIFIGCHGRKGIRKLMVGSVSEKVIGHAKCPVFIKKA